jgi:tol-pal system protein YbgF
MLRLAAILIASSWFATAALAQTQEEYGALRLHVQQLEELVRQLTGENERLNYEVGQLRAQLGQAGIVPGPEQTGAVTAEPLPQTPPQPAPDALGTPPQDLGSISIAPDDPLIAPDGDPLLIPDGTQPGGPIDLSVLAGGAPAAATDPSTGLPIPDANAGTAVPVAPALPGETQTAALPGTPAPTTALSGSPRDEYDLAYGYILTGDYGLAEASFRNWLAAFPNDPQAADAQFWLGESLYQQSEYRDAANAFLAVYNGGAQSSKGPDALLKLGMSLAALGEQSAACATFGEVSRRYPEASAALMSRVNEEAGRVGC